MSLWDRLRRAVNEFFSDEEKSVSKPEKPWPDYLPGIAEPLPGTAEAMGERLRLEGPKAFPNLFKTFDSIEDQFEVLQIESGINLSPDQSDTVLGWIDDGRVTMEELRELFEDIAAFWEWYNEQYG